MIVLLMCQARAARNQNTRSDIRRAAEMLDDGVTVREVRRGGVGLEVFGCELEFWQALSLSFPL